MYPAVVDSGDAARSSIYAGTGNDFILDARRIDVVAERCDTCYRTVVLSSNRARGVRAVEVRRVNAQVADRAASGDFGEYARVFDRAGFTSASDVEAEYAEAAPVEYAGETVLSSCSYRFELRQDARVDVVLEREIVAEESLRVNGRSWILYIVLYAFELIGVFDPQVDVFAGVVCETAVYVAFFVNALDFHCVQPILKFRARADFSILVEFCDIVSTRLVVPHIEADDEVAVMLTAPVVSLLKWLTKS